MIPEPRRARRISTLFLALALSVGVPFTALSFVQYLHHHPVLAIGAISAYELVLAGTSFLSLVSSDLRIRWSNRLADALDSWMRRRFSSYTRAYLSYVRAYTRYMDAKGLSTAGQHVFEMRDVLISLALSATSLHRLSPDPVRRHSDKSSNDANEIWYWLKEARQGGNLLSIIGPPGSGKTTLLRHVAFVLSSPRNHSRPPNVPKRLPVLINLREHKSWGSGNAFNLADLIRANLVGLNRSEPPSWVEANLRSGRFAILLDGLDEIPQPDARTELADWLSRQVSAQAGNLFILTSRPFGYRENPVDGAIVVEVQPLAESQISTFVTQWYRAAETRSHGEDNLSSRLAAAAGATELLASLDQMPSLFALTANPLLLTMLVNVHYYRGALPGSRVELYDEICDVFLAKRDRARGVRVEIPGARKRFVLQVLAHEMTSHGITQVKSIDASEYVTAALSSVREQLAPTDFFRAIEDAAGLIVEKERGVYSFAHLTLQEYLCAEYLKENRAVDEVVSNIESPWWRETIRLYAAMSDATPIVATCLDRRDEGDLLLLGLQCAEDANVIDAAILSAAHTCLYPPQAREDIGARHVAARARLQMRMQHDFVLRRNSFIARPNITWLEYQYFVDSRSNTSSVVPDHWREGIYPAGSDDDAVVGVRYQDAVEFCNWLATELQSSFMFRLPLVSEIDKALERLEARELAEGLGFWTLTQQPASRDGRFWPLLRFQTEGSRRDVYPFSQPSLRSGGFAAQVSSDLLRVRAEADTERDASDQSALSDNIATSLASLIDDCWPVGSACDVGQTLADIQLANVLVKEYVHTYGLVRGARPRLFTFMEELRECSANAFDRSKYADRGGKHMCGLRDRARAAAIGAAADCLRIHAEYGAGVFLPPREKVTKPTARIPNPSRQPTVAMNVLARAFVSIYADLLILEARLSGRIIPTDSIMYVRESIGVVQEDVDSEAGDYPRHLTKEIFDRLVAAVALVALAPLLVFIALAIRLSDGGPAIFRQIRVGRNGRLFTLYKFRTMVVNAEDRLADLMAANESSGVLFKMRKDPRVTTLGARLRRYTLDELPNLFNVLRGDMSLVGPRPALPDEEKHYSDFVRARLLVRPGLVGLWQVNGRSDLSWDEAVRLDLTYVENWSFGLDLQILWKAVSVIFRGSGAY